MRYNKRYNNKLENLRENFENEIKTLAKVANNIGLLDEDMTESCDIPIDDYEMSMSMKYVSIITIINNNNNLTLLDDNEDEYNLDDTTIEGLADIVQWLKESIIDNIFSTLNDNTKEYDLEGVEITTEDAEDVLNLITNGSTIENAVETILQGIFDVLNN